MSERELYSPTHISTLVVNGTTILFGIFFAVLYIKAKSFHNYPCYNKLAINFIILLDNAIRIIPIGVLEDDKTKFLPKSQAFLLIFLDKFFLIILTNQIIIQYFGIMHPTFYFQHEKKIFFYGTILSALISIAIAGVFLSDDIIHKSDKFYWYGNNDVYFKKVIDTVYDGVLLLINVLCLIIIIINSNRYSKKAKISGMETVYYEHNFKQALIKFFVNASTYVISFIIIFRVLSGTGMTDFTYLLNCLVVDICYCLNKNVIKEFCILCCCKKYKDGVEVNDYKKRIDTYGMEEGISNYDDEDY